MSSETGSTILTTRRLVWGGIALVAMATWGFLREPAHAPGAPPSHAARAGQTAPSDAPTSAAVSRVSGGGAPVEITGHSTEVPRAASREQPAAPERFHAAPHERDLAAAAAAEHEQDHAHPHESHDVDDPMVWAALAGEHVDADVPDSDADSAPPVDADSESAAPGGPHAQQILAGYQDPEDWDIGDAPDGDNELDSPDAPYEGPAGDLDWSDDETNVSLEEVDPSSHPPTETGAFVAPE